MHLHVFQHEVNKVLADLPFAGVSADGWVTFWSSVNQ